jgi:hypothetical protein
MELLKQFAPEFAENQLQEKALIFENEKLSRRIIIKKMNMEKQ